MGLESPSHWLIVAVVVIVLFGYKKLPEMSRSVGRSLRIFKTEMKGLNDDDTARDGEAAASTPTVAVAAPAVVAPSVVTPSSVVPAPAAPAVVTPSVTVAPPSQAAAPAVMAPVAAAPQAAAAPSVPAVNGARSETTQQMGV